MKLGRSYTNAVDLWALGVLVDKILTSEVVFLEQAGESNISTSTIDSVPAIDMDLLYRYCRDPELFPVSALPSNGVNPDWEGFVKPLMAVDPRIRLTAADALSGVALIEIDARLISDRLTLLPVQVQNKILNRFLACEGDFLAAKLAGLVGRCLRVIRNKSPIYANLPTGNVIPQKLDNLEQDLALLQMAAIINATSRGFKNQTTFSFHPLVVNIHGEAAQQDRVKPVQGAAAGGLLHAMSLLIPHEHVGVRRHLAEVNARAGTTDSRTLRPEDKQLDPIEMVVEDILIPDIVWFDILGRHSCRQWAGSCLLGRTSTGGVELSPMPQRRGLSAV